MYNEIYEKNQSTIVHIYYFDLHFKKHVCLKIRYYCLLSSMEEIYLRNGDSFFTDSSLATRMAKTERKGMELNLKLDRYSASRIIQISSNHLRNHPTRISPDFNLKSKTQPVGNGEKDHVTASIRFRFRG